MRDPFHEGAQSLSVFPEETRPCLCALASGSKGNAVFISDGHTRILLDAGLSGKDLTRRMESRGLRADELSAIVVSHEHIDHVRGVGVLARRLGVPVYITEATLAALPSSVGVLPEVRLFRAGAGFTVGSLAVHPFSISHDAADPCGFRILAGGVRIGVATDLGVATSVVRHHLGGCSALLIEANHDLRMLEDGPYPWPVKQRVMSRSGHLSNESARDLLSDLLHDGLSHVVLGHISQTNNLPEKALEVCGPVLDGHGAHLCAASQDACGELFVLECTKPARTA